MAMVRVWNDNKYEYRETFKGDKVVIPAGKFIEMQEDEAIQFKGTFSPPVLDSDGNHKPEGFKMIRLERITAEMIEEAKVNELKCLACAKELATQAQLDAHIKEAHADQHVKDEEAEEELKIRAKRKKAS